MPVTPVTTVATSEVMGAGSVFEFSTDGGTTWKILRGLASIPEIGSESPSKDVADISETAPRYINTFPENQEIELAMAQLPSDADQVAFMTAARTRALIDIRVTYSTGVTVETGLKLLRDYAGEANKNDEAMFGAKGRLSGEQTWGTVA